MRLQERIGTCAMAVQSPSLRAEFRASIRVRLQLPVWPQGNAHSVPEV